MKYKLLLNQTIDKILLGTERQVPNCLDTKKRIQNLNFYMQVQEHDGVSSVDFISFSFMSTTI